MVDTERLSSKAEKQEAAIRFLHAAYDVGNLDIYLNGQVNLSNFAYKTAVGFFRIPSGTYQIAVYPAGEKEKSLVSKRLQIKHLSLSYTIAIAGKADCMEILSFENSVDVPIGEAKIRFLHLAFDTSALDIAVKARDVVFPKLHFAAATYYLGITPMTVDLEARATGGKEIVLPLPKMKFLADHAYSIALTGSARRLPNLEAIVLID